MISLAMSYELNQSGFVTSVDSFSMGWVFIHSTPGSVGATTPSNDRTSENSPNSKPFFSKSETARTSTEVTLHPNSVLGLELSS